MRRHDPDSEVGCSWKKTERRTEARIQFQAAELTRVALGFERHSGHRLNSAICDKCLREFLASRERFHAWHRVYGRRTA